MFPCCKESASVSVAGGWGVEQSLHIEFSSEADAQVHGGVVVAVELVGEADELWAGERCTVLARSLVFVVGGLLNEKGGHGMVVVGDRKGQLSKGVIFQLASFLIICRPALGSARLGSAISQPRLLVLSLILPPLLLSPPPRFPLAIHLFTTSNYHHLFHPVCSRGPFCAPSLSRAFARFWVTQRSVPAQRIRTHHSCAPAAQLFSFCAQFPIRVILLSYSSIHLRHGC